MVKRGPNVVGLVVMAAVYWGALFYWIKDDLQSNIAEDQTRAVILFATSIPYVAYVIWGTMSDLPEGLSEIPFIGKYLKLYTWLAIVLALAYWGWVDTAAVGFLLVGVALFGLGTGLALSCLLYTGEEASRLYGMRRLVDVYPSITKPEGHVRFNQKLWTTVLVLIIYFMMTNVMIYGLSDTTLDVFSSFRAIMAGASGSIMHLGIGPIVTGSIIMQLFSGAKIIQLDLQDAGDKQLYQGVQKILVLIMIPIESIPQVYGFLDPSETMILDYGVGWASALIVSQLFLGSLLVFLLDELVSKWGIGSGISLFIAAGVAQSTFVGTLSPLPTVEGAPLSFDNPPSGTLPMIFYTLRTATNQQLVSQNGFELMLLNHANPIAALISSIVVFLVVAYAESSKLELPLTHGKVRGHRGQYPIRLVYASNIPVILMAALLANVNMFTLLFWSHPTLSTVPILGRDGWNSKAHWFGSYEAGATTPSDGFAWYSSMVNGVGAWLIPLLNQTGDAYGHSLTQIMTHVFVYVFFMTAGSTVFAKFWIETTNMGAKDVAKQIERTGMQIPGFRKNPVVLERILERYIPPVTLFSGAFVGLLAAGADLLGTVGNATGTGLLLAVGIILRTYEQIQKEQAMEMHPVLREFFGAE
ncbi:MAG: preprotein translocase subunit SecY [Candidatus Thalassarchaeaceae archaeon]|jgi:preprotein translocase subunit SecY|nr:preprotein translocase subunit SecY [Candidatus Thalassarchaeaceae archaeon]MDP7091697.1 preprotein translocase subunit SecY [Candidatus Thalassarchaeaceae archaeon]MDP7256918.1 preprotein translocase subunit SecY [Candidatus Thalassarchaeaceae archaeon]MDP7446676.1 preprotein translocase subunit SecY [Candidatus Thalassarchaeaceae archaeon]MDP7649199.1 preprotein translocase subunit SecY [Candidatus Thalassarchaeaceae archaeon]|tara:strand:+ start:12585 stop:14507 length:1923 start_codon:yes stop_codon:yes gene_type:complete